MAWMPGFSSQETIATALALFGLALLDLALLDLVFFDLAPAFFLQHCDFTIDAQNLGHLPFELGVTIFKIVAHLVRLDLLVAENLADGALDQMGQAPMPCRRPPSTGMIGQQSRRPQLVRIAMVFGLVARQRCQPRPGFRRDRRSLPGRGRSSRAKSGP
ncbi:hypothetical protein [Bradyrhizobium sp. Tv2a-2]|uniref:hypothetical protein n=1 Tax=Bradyrhizobium sp. Tv2a-2 TaxID=113395 RepID=UPI0004655A77|nr:hypothetical protein [Bradyrhizobium sp. Tv2a-2]